MPAFPAVVIVPGASFRLAAALAAGHGATIAALALADLPWPARVALALAVVVSLLLAVREHVLHDGDAIVSIAASPAGPWRVATRRRGGADAELLTDNLVLPWLTVLAFRFPDGRRRHVILVPDNAPPDDFRRLRVIVRNGGERDP